MSLASSAKRIVSTVASSRSIDTIFAPVNSALVLVERRIEERLNSEAPILSEIASYLQQLGGKRVRPLLCLLSARVFGMREASSRLVDVAAGIELIHMATLLHDDIIDESPVRRKKESAFVRFGVPPSLLTGDFLLVRAFGLCAHLGDYIIDATERACVALTEGEVLEGKLSQNRTVTFENYLDVIGKKTASLFSLAAETGAYVAEADQNCVLALKSFGFDAGITFQIVDDILDITADEILLGKPLGTDLKQKSPSLVNILWLQTDDPLAKEFHAADSLSAEDCKQLVKHLRNSPVIEHCREIARSFALRAKSNLDSLEESNVDQDITGKLRSLIDFTLERCL